ncbi:hypothetical protein A4A49_63730, partial [Nicotiana attenuata]
KPAPIDLPKFDRINAESWTLQANQYFDRYHSLLAKLQMTTSVHDYLSQFEKLANRTTEMSPPMLKHCFTSGLHPDIKADVLSFRPVDLNEAIGLAFLQEQKHMAQPKSSPRPTSFSKPPVFSPTHQTTPYPKLNQPPSLSSHSPSASLPGVGRVPFKKLTQAEIQRKRELNLCFNCDEKYQKGHRCSSQPQLFLLLPEDNPTDNTIFDNSPPPSDSPQPDTPLESPSLLTISLHAFAGGLSPSTLRFTAVVKGNPVQVLIDGGSTHNFMHPRTAKKFKLPVEPASAFSVLVGNGQTLSCLGVIYR